MSAEAPVQLAKAAVRWCAASVVWSAAAGVSAAVVGLTVSSAALLGFGANSILDGAASAVLIWRFGAGRSHASDADVVERRAVLAVSVVMIGVALYVAATAISAIADHASPTRSVVGIVLTAASTLVLPVLARAKLGLAVGTRQRGVGRVRAQRHDAVRSASPSSITAITSAATESAHHQPSAA